MDSFELRKREANPNRTTTYNIFLSYSFIEYFGLSAIEKLLDKAPNGLAFSAKLGILRIDAPLMHSLFQKVIEPTIKILETMLNNVLRLKEISYIFLVGGFAESSMLKREMKLTFEPAIKIIVPYQPYRAVLYGACRFGLDPTIIQSRRMMRTYGIGVLAKFDPTIHPKSKMINKANGDWCCDLFDKFVTINQSIGMFEMVKRKYKPVFTNQTSCIFHIYSTTNVDAKFITDPNVDKCGTLYLELDAINFSKEINPAIKQLFQRVIEVQMFFGETEIKVIK